MQTGPPEDDTPRHSSIHEAAVLVSPHALQEGDRGLVVVGSSLHLGDLMGQDAAREQPQSVCAGSAVRRCMLN